jgi:hypothetical protein
MHTESSTVLTHLSDEQLLHDLTSLVARERALTAALLAHLAEVDARRLYVPAGYPSMYAYCVGELKFSEDEAYKRIQVARAGRKAPALLAALADQRVTITAARVLAPHLTPENAAELLETATHRTTADVEQRIVRRFGRIEPSAIALPLATTADAPAVGPAEVGGADTPAEVATGTIVVPAELVSRPVELPRELANSEPQTAAAAPAHEERTLLRVAVGHATLEKLTYARQLLGHAVPTGDVGQVIDRALTVLIARLEKRKFAATERPRSKPEPRPQSRTNVAQADHPSHKRSIVAEVKREVWRRDGGRCTYVAPSGRRCEARHRLEYDHVDPVALGGGSTVDGLRLRCRAHNQFEAERVFGPDFMRAKREAARRSAAERHRGAGGGEMVHEPRGPQARLEPQPP